MVRLPLKTKSDAPFFILGKTGVPHVAHHSLYSLPIFLSACDHPFIGFPRLLNPGLPICAGDWPSKAEFVFECKTSQSSRQIPYGISDKNKSIDSLSRSPKKLWQSPCVILSI